MMQAGFLRICAFALLAAAHAGAQNIFGTNLIVNGNAEAGPAGTGVPTLVGSIPGWTRVGTGNNINVVPYNLKGYVAGTDPAPADHSFNYFVGAGYPNGVTMTQDIDVSSGAATIGGGNVTYTVSAYLGSATPTDYFGTAQLDVAFKNAGGQTFSTATIGPLAYIGNGMSRQSQLGIVPSGTSRITVTLTMKGLNGGYAAADSLSLVLAPISSAPGSVLGTNLITNPGAETGPSAQPTLGPSLNVTPYIPGWSTQASVSVAPYGGARWIQTTDSGPADRGVNLFCGGSNGAQMYQDINVAPASALIDAGSVQFAVSGWLGSLPGNGSPTLTYTFFDWTGKQLATTAQLGPPTHSGAGLIELTGSGTLPAGTRRVHLAVTFPSALAVADNIGFILAGPSAAPVITPGGILSASAFGGFSAISPGSWIEIYGVNLAPASQGWAGSDFVNGVAPTALGGVTVSIGGKAAFIDYVSPSQVNALVPSDAPIGPIAVTLSNANGTSDGYGIYVNQAQPGLLAPASFQIAGKQYLAALLSDGSFAVPQNAIPNVTSRAAKPGETLILYGVGFGPVTGGFTAGTVVTQANALTTPLQVLFGNTAVTPTYNGLAPNYTGLYQFNIVVPSVAPNNALPVSFTLGGTKGTQTLYIAVSN